MHIHILGTSAAEGFPGLFCRCVHCNRARELGGKNIRTRSSALVDGKLKIDFPPDTLHHVLRDGLDLAAVEHLLITHTHHDHLHAEELGMRVKGYAHGFEHPLTVYGNESAIKLCRTAVGPASEFSFRLLRPFATIEAGDYRITPLPADHAPYEMCLLYVIEKDGKRLLYGHDSGWFPEETWAWLEREAGELHAVVLDCTNGNIPVKRNHMNIEAVIETKRRLMEAGALRETASVIATHFSHNIGLLHEDLVSLLSRERIMVAYDGMKLTV